MVTQNQRRQRAVVSLLVMMCTSVVSQNVECRLKPDESGALKYVCEVDQPLPMVNVITNNSSEAPTAAPTVTMRTIVPQLQYLGEPVNIQTPLENCQGDCDTDWDCGYGLNCFHRRAKEPVPGCGRDGIRAVDYCYIPRPGELVVVGSNSTSNIFYPFGQCEGHCESDADCISGLQCFVRDDFEAVPGCTGVGAQGTNYCYLAPPSDQPSSVPSDQPSDVPSLTPSVELSAVPFSAMSVTPSTEVFVETEGTRFRFAGFPPHNPLLGMCEGHCASDADCELGLVCERRVEFDKMSSCSGVGMIGVNYCVEPQDGQLRLIGNEKDALHFPYGMCEGHCTCSLDCRAGLQCFRRDDVESVPGCSGSGASGRNYCYDPDDSDFDGSEVKTASPSVMESSAIVSDYPSDSPSDLPSEMPSDLPSDSPSTVTSDYPSSEPSQSPVLFRPTEGNSYRPSLTPSLRPSIHPSASPSSVPSIHQSGAPSQQKTMTPTSFRGNDLEESSVPTFEPSTVALSDPPSIVHTNEQSSIPTSTQDSRVPSASPSVFIGSIAPSSTPSVAPAETESSKPSTVTSGTPSIAPTVQQSSEPSAEPLSMSPSKISSTVPSNVASSSVPSAPPFVQQSSEPSVKATSLSPSAVPSVAATSNVPSLLPSVLQSSEPSRTTSSAPSGSPSTAATTNAPLVIPSVRESSDPTVQAAPSDVPSAAPSNNRSIQVSPEPSVPSVKTSSLVPSDTPSAAPSIRRSVQESAEPSVKTTSLAPSDRPSTTPSSSPSVRESIEPSVKTPSVVPSDIPSAEPSDVRSIQPSAEPSEKGTSIASSDSPSTLPSITVASNTPTSLPSVRESFEPSVDKTPLAPSDIPSAAPSNVRSIGVSDEPSVTSISMAPSDNPSALPSIAATSDAPSFSPSIQESFNPSVKITSSAPSDIPSAAPSNVRSIEVSDEPSVSSISMAPSDNPSTLPSIAATSDTPSLLPSVTTSDVPSAAPSIEADSDVPSPTPSYKYSDSPSDVPSVAGSSDLPSLSPSVNHSFEPSIGAKSSAPSMLGNNQVGDNSDAPSSVPTPVAAGSKELEYLGLPPYVDARLSECQGDCDSDLDCDFGLNCFRRIAFEPVPNCLGTGIRAIDYCYVPPSGHLVVTDIGANISLNKCEGHCRTDSDCVGALKCFQRQYLQEVPGCYGLGAVGTDYCYDPNDEVPSNPNLLRSQFPSDAPSQLPSDEPSSVPSTIPTTASPSTFRDNQIGDRSDAPSDLPSPAVEGSKELELIGRPPFGDDRLDECQGDCDSDLDCGFGLNCFRRLSAEPVPGCTGSGMEGANYCYVPPPGRLVVTGTGPDLSLEKCEGHCEDDSDCTGKLKCFKRLYLQEVPGCDGLGAVGMNYCYDPEHVNEVEPPSLSPAASLSYFPSDVPTSVIASDIPSRATESDIPSSLFTSDLQSRVPSDVPSTITTSDVPSQLPSDEPSSVPSTIPTTASPSTFRDNQFEDRSDAPSDLPSPAVEGSKELELIGRPPFGDDRLDECQGDCDSDLDCGFGLNCFRRLSAEPVPGCTGSGMEGANYCYVPPPGRLVVTGTGPDLSLEKCEGHCEADSDCAGELKCFKRLYLQEVPGCDGLGAVGMNYCYDPEHVNEVEPPSLSPAASLSYFPSDVPTSVIVSDDPSTALASDDPSSVPSGFPSAFGNQNEDKSDAPSDFPSREVEGSKELEFIGRPPFGDDRLDECQGDCDSDLDCGFGLNCFRRLSAEPVPGCTGSGMEGVNYCYVPPPGRLVVTGTGPDLSLEKCEGHCEADSDCAGKLKCFKRLYLQEVPGCDGLGAIGINYCYDAIEATDSDMPFAFPSSAPSLVGVVSMNPVTSGTVHPTGLSLACNMDINQRRVGITQVIQTVSSAESLANPMTTQHKALNWVVNDDGFRVCPGDQNVLQRYILALLYFQTSGDFWERCSANQTGHQACEGEPFLSASHECFWGGIRCESNVTVTALHLDDNKLFGPLPSEIGALEDLAELDMDNNALVGKLPASLGNLTKLEVLDLDENLLTGAIPVELFNATSLRVLDLDSNQFTGSLPTQVSRLHNLYFIQLDFNLMTGGIPSELGSLTDLRFLSAIQAGFSDAIPSSLCGSDIDIIADCQICTIEGCCSSCFDN